jgi:LL-diaminopimelate aminotransferase
MTQTTAATQMTGTTPLNHLDAFVAKQWRNRDEYIMFRLARRVEQLTPELTAKGRAPLKLSIGAPTLPPPQVIVDALVEALKQPGIHMYSTTRGELSFRKAVAQRMAQRFGVTVDPASQVMSVVGSKEGLANFFRGIINPSLPANERDVLLIPDPGYASYVESIEAAGGLPYSIPLTVANAYQPDLNQVLADAVASGIAPQRIKAVVINYPSNPLGATVPYSYYEHVLEVAERHNLLIISDNAYADMYFSEAAKPHSMLEVPGALERTIEFHSLSKPYAMTGWRLGYAVGPKPLIDLLALVKGTVDSGAFKAIQHAASVALTDPSVEAAVQHTNKTVYAALQQRFVAGLERLGWPVDTMKLPDATFYFWLPIPPRFNGDDVAFANALLETSGIVTVPGTGFGRYGAGFVRLSLVLPAEQQDDVIERMQTDGFTWH